MVVLLSLEPTHPRSKCEFQIVGSEGVIIDRRIDTLSEQLFVSVDVFGDSKPESEQLFMSRISDARARVEL